MTQKWITADGKEVDLYTICHQHLSNIYYYTHFILSESYPQSVRNKVVDALNSRFDGKALPYDPKFKWEIEYLKKRRWLKADGSIVITTVGAGGYKHIKIR